MPQKRVYYVIEKVAYNTSLVSQNAEMPVIIREQKILLI